MTTSALEGPSAGDDVARRLERAWASRRGLRGWLSTVDHKRIGIRYLVTAWIYLLIGGLDALAMRVQLARPSSAILTPQYYNELFTMHGVTMIFWYAAPMLSGFGNYLIPLVIGSRDMAFPRLNAFSYWTFLLSGLIVHVSILFSLAPDGGWFAYVPLTTGTYSPSLGLDFYTLSLLFLSISTTAGAINFIVTIFRHRCPGMSVSRMPLMAWSTLTASVSIVFALPPLSAALIFLELDRRYGTHFFDPAAGGSPMLWQHLFWVFGHPWVYIIVLPATGMASMMIPTFCRRPIVGYAWVALATVSTGILGFGVWVHHMFATGLPPLSTTFFSAASMGVSIPSGIQIFAWLATIWAARRHVFTTAFLFMLGFLVLFTIGGISGVMTAAVPFDWQVTDSYFIVAHLHYVLIGINFFPVMGAVYYWFPKMSGRMLDERVGKWVFWILFTGTNLTFFPMHMAGLEGMPRRVYTYPAGMGWDVANLVETAGAFLFAAGIVLFVVDLLRSLRTGAPAGPNPWGASSLEWSTSSPPPVYNFAVIPVVASRDPLWDAKVVTPGSSAPAFRVLDHGKQVLASSALDAVPEGAVTAPPDTLWPLLLSLTLGLLFLALLVKSPIAAGAGVVLSLIATAAWLIPREETP